MIHNTSHTVLLQMHNSGRSVLLQIHSSGHSALLLIFRYIILVILISVLLQIHNSGHFVLLQMHNSFCPATGKYFRSFCPVADRSFRNSVKIQICVPIGGQGSNTDSLYYLQIRALCRRPLDNYLFVYLHKSYVCTYKQ